MSNLILILGKSSFIADTKFITAAKEISSVSNKVLKNINDGLWFCSEEDKFNFSAKKTLSKSEYEFYQARKTHIDVLKLRVKEHDEAKQSSPYSLLKLAEIKGFEEYQKRLKESNELTKKQTESLVKSLSCLYPNKHQLAPDGEIVVAVNSYLQNISDDKKKAAAQKRKENAAKKKQAQNSSTSLLCSVIECPYPSKNISSCDQNICFFKFCEAHKDHENHKFQTKTNIALIEEDNRKKAAELPNETLVALPTVSSSSNGSNNQSVEDGSGDSTDSSSTSEESPPIVQKVRKRKQSELIADDSENKANLIKNDFQTFTSDPKNKRKSHITSYCVCEKCFQSTTSTFQIIDEADMKNCLINKQHKNLKLSCWMAKKQCSLCKSSNSSSSSSSTITSTSSSSS